MGDRCTELPPLVRAVPRRESGRARQSCHLSERWQLVHARTDLQRAHALAGRRARQPHPGSSDAPPAAAHSGFRCCAGARTIGRIIRACAHLVRACALARSLSSRAPSRLLPSCAVLCDSMRARARIPRPLCVGIFAQYTCGPGSIPKGMQFGPARDQNDAPRDRPRLSPGLRRGRCESDTRGDPDPKPRPAQVDFDHPTTMHF